MRTFAYGSNMDPVQMRRRCPSARFVARAWLPDFALAFPRWSPKRGCGVADVVPAPGGRVWGVVYDLDEEDGRALDGYEGAPTDATADPSTDRERPAYRRVRLRVEPHAGDLAAAEVPHSETLGAARGAEPWTVHAYRVVRPVAWHVPPDAAYLGHLLRGAAAWGLPDAYRAELRSIVGAREPLLSSRQEEGMDSEGPDALTRARALQASLTAWRRHLHMHPETAYQETGTSAYLRGVLHDLELRPSDPMAETGFTCLIPGRGDGPTVALRADMDALPIEEANEVPYASKHPGVAHLCGHDAHCAMLLGAASLLAERRPERGNVQLVFQPAEEDGAGAERMIEDGALRDPEVGAIFALHVHPGADAGQVRFRPGQVHAAVDGFDLTVRGAGGHAAHPHTAIDAVAVAGQVITALQQLPSRLSDPLKPLVITIGTIQGGYARNVIAPEVRMRATVRTLHDDLRQQVPTWVERLVDGVTRAYGASYDLDWHDGYPSAINEPELAPFVRDTAASVVGADAVQEGPASMGGEDFAYYGRVVPAFIARLGVRDQAAGFVHPLHHPRFDLDESALPIGAALLHDLALRWLADAAGDAA
ncbi:MAG: amidohydrolase [Trueperaceae bacterium]